MNADQILELTGSAVLLNARKGSKAPFVKEWPSLTLADVGPAYKASLRGNIGVSLGEPSLGLHTIDCDTDDVFKVMLESNPHLTETLQSHGVRGGNFWVRIDGKAPKSCKLKAHDGKALGEWRGTGNQTIIYGTHPSGIEYRNNGKTAITIPFADLKWPDTWLLPWEQKQETDETAKHDTGPRDRSRVSTESVRVLLASIPSRPSYDVWLKVAAAVRHGVGDKSKAIELLKEWSPEEKKGEYAELLASPFPEITFATLVFLAGQHGFSGAVRRFFYNGRSFCMESPSGFIPLPCEAPVRQHLSVLGIPSKRQAEVLCSIREQQMVGYIGPVAGLKHGLHECNGDKVLVTKGPTIIEGNQGSYTFVHDILTGLLGDPDHPQQLETFLDWLAHSRRAVQNGKRVQTPVVVFTGKRGNGKSLAIEVIKRSLGGRSAKAYQFMSGDSRFNADLVGSELLVVDDAAASKDHRSRITLATNIKDNLFSGAFSMEGKGRDKIDCHPIHAMVMAVNEDPDHLRVLPELEGSMRDKINLFKTQAAAIPEGADSAEISRRLTEALPAFLFDIDRRDISGAYDTQRRLKCFWHPEVLEALGCLSPERQLLELIQECWSVSEDIRQHGKWTGSASELESKLTEFGASTTNAAKRLLSWPAACGTYLGRLSDTEGTGVAKEGWSPSKIRRYAISVGG
jgi:hypothetical protein